MASSHDSGSLHPTAPLDRITNATTSSHSSHGSHQDPGAEATRKSVHRSLSPRFLRRELASSETSEQEEDSIYNADPVNLVGGLSWSTESLPRSDLTVSVVSSRPPTPRSSPEATPTSHSQWPARQLGAIVEQNSIRGLRRATSVSRLTVGPARSSSIVPPPTSLHSVHADASSRPSDQLYGWRSFSANDLDSRRLVTATKRSSPQSTSSAGDALDLADWCPTLPNRPPQSPPHRVPTPPGLPSFGTVEATEYRLVPPPSPARALWSRIWSSSHDSDELQSASPQMLPSPLLAPQSRPTSPPVEILRRTLARIGMSSVVTPPSEPSNGPRVSLPAGVYKCNEPGALARADDGTLISGRFAPRASGHGIGQRDLDSHPFADTATIDDQVREIDKACERMEMETAAARTAWNESARPEGGNAVQEPEPGPDPTPETNQIAREPRRASRSQQLHSDDGSGMSPSVFLSPPSASLSRVDLPIPFRSLDPSWFDSRGYRTQATMRYAPLRAPSTLMSLRTADTTTAMPSFADEVERNRIRELVMDDKRRQQNRPWNQLQSALEDCCYHFWDTWCVKCCTGDRRGQDNRRQW